MISFQRTVSNVGAIFLVDDDLQKDAQHLDSLTTSLHQRKYPMKP